jgi:hypothetical protein
MTLEKWQGKEAVTTFPLTGLRLHRLVSCRERCIRNEKRQQNIVVKQCLTLSIVSGTFIWYIRRFGSWLCFRFQVTGYSYTKKLVSYLSLASNITSAQHSIPIIKQPLWQIFSESKCGGILCHTRCPSKQKENGAQLKLCRVRTAFDLP